MCGRTRNPALRQVSRIVEEWLLLEYACVYLPAQQNAVVEAVSKGMPLPDDVRRALNLPSTIAPLTFTPLPEIEKHVRRRLEAIDFERLANEAATRALDRARGRV